MRKLALALVLLAPLVRSNIHTIPTITGSGATVSVCAAVTSICPARAKWIQVIAKVGNSGPVMFGDSTVTSSVGLPIAAGAGYNTPACQSCIYSPGATYVYIGSMDVAYVAWGD